MNSRCLDKQDYHCFVFPLYESIFCKILSMPPILVASQEYETLYNLLRLNLYWSLLNYIKPAFVETTEI